jgi:hypothetical protein
VGIIRKMVDGPSLIFIPGTPDQACASGIAVLDAVRTLEAMVGPVAVTQAKALLTTTEQAELEAATPYAWVPLATLSHFFDAVARVVEREPEALVDEVVRRAVEHTFKTVWRMFLRVTSDDALVKRTPLIYARSRNVGQLDAKLLERGHAELRLTGWPVVSDRQLRLLAISIQSVLVIAGRRSVTYNYTRTPHGGHYELHWRT